MRGAMLQRPKSINAITAMNYELRRQWYFMLENHALYNDRPGRSLHIQAVMQALATGPLTEPAFPTRLTR